MERLVAAMLLAAAVAGAALIPRMLGGHTGDGPLGLAAPSSSGGTFVQAASLPPAQASERAGGLLPVSPLTPLTRLATLTPLRLPRITEPSEHVAAASRTIAPGTAAAQRSAQPTVQTATNGAPTTPAAPTTPTSPTTPATPPSEPQAPSQPQTPSQPQAPSHPQTPSHPQQPSQPVTPPTAGPTAPRSPGPSPAPQQPAPLDPRSLATSPSKGDDSGRANDGHAPRVRVGDRGRVQLTLDRNRGQTPQPVLPVVPPSTTVATVPSAPTSTTPSSSPGATTVPAAPAGGTTTPTPAPTPQPDTGDRGQSSPPVSGGWVRGSLPTTSGGFGWGSGR